MTKKVPETKHTSSNKTKIIAKPLYENIPKELKSCNSWTTYTTKYDKEKNIHAKKPDGAHGAASISSFEKAKGRVDAGSTGIGFSFYGEEHGTLIGLDLDHVALDIDGDVPASKWDALPPELKKTYCEYSISGDGLHIIIDCPDWDYDEKINRKPLNGFFTKGKDLEVFIKNCFLTVSGKKYPGAPDTIGSIPAKKIMALIEKQEKAKAKRSKKAIDKKIRAIQATTGSNDFSSIENLVAHITASSTLTVVDYGEGMIHLSECPWGDEHGGDDHPVIFHENGRIPRFYCFHNTCSKRTWASLCEKYPKLNKGNFIDDYNTQYFKIKSHGMVRIGGDKSGFGGSLTEELLTVKAFHEDRLHDNFNFNGKKVFKSKEWLEHPDCRYYPKGFVLKPVAKVEPGEYNLWSGFKVEPSEKGDWSLLQKHWKDNICGGREELYEWFLDWVADMFQNPVKHVWSAVIVKGKQGLGKSILGKFISDIIGTQHSAEVTSKADLFDKFDFHLNLCAFINASEITFEGDKKGHDELKGRITRPVAPMEKKFQSIIRVTNINRLFITTNNFNAIPAEAGERRFLLMEIKNRTPKSAFVKMVKQMNRGGGCERMLYDLLNRKITRDVNDPPATEELIEESLAGADSVGQFLQHKLASETWGLSEDVDAVFEGDTDEGDWPSDMGKDALYLDYHNFVKGADRYMGNMRTKEIFLRMLYALGFEKTTKRSGCKRLRVPSREALNKIVRREYGGESDKMRE